jgi:hypothetical protein
MQLGYATLNFILALPTVVHCFIQTCYFWKFAENFFLQGWAKTHEVIGRKHKLAQDHLKYITNSILGPIPHCVLENTTWGQIQDCWGLLLLTLTTKERDRKIGWLQSWEKYKTLLLIWQLHCWRINDPDISAEKISLMAVQKSLKNYFFPAKPSLRFAHSHKMCLLQKLYSFL